VILNYTGVVAEAIRAWEEIDPCSPMIPEPLLAELAAGADSMRETSPADGPANG
jgi:hypothetical protein